MLSVQSVVKNAPNRFSQEYAKIAERRATRLFRWKVEVEDVAALLIAGIGGNELRASELLVRLRGNHSLPIPGARIVTITRQRTIHSALLLSPFADLIGPPRVLCDLCALLCNGSDERARQSPSRVRPRAARYASVRNLS